MSSSRTLLLAVGACVLAGGAVFLGWRWHAHNTGPKPPPPKVVDLSPWKARPAVFVTDLAKSEAANDKAAAAVKATLIRGLRDRDWKIAASGLTKDFRAHFPARETGSVVPNGTMTIRVYKREGLEELDATGFLDRMKDHLDPWSLVERTTWRPFTFLMSPEENRAWFEAHFEVGGPAVKGGRGDVVAMVEGELVKEGEDWKVRSFGLQEGYRVENPLPPFTDVTDVTGFRFPETEENKKSQQALINARVLNVNGGLSVVDWNHDGFPDVIAMNQGRFTELFLNDGKGGFVRGELPMKKPEESGYMCLMLDLDGDGQEELVTGENLSYVGNQGQMGIYTRRNGAWELIPDALRFDVLPGRREIVTSCVIPCDVNQDGLVDLFIGQYSDFHSKKDEFNFVAAYDGCGGKLFINHGGLKFTEESEARGIHSTQYTLTAMFFDLDGDGDQDLIQVNDFGPNVFWENQGDGHFIERKDHFLAKGSSYSMGITIADYDNTGDWTIHVSNMYSHAGNRIVSLSTGLNEEMAKTARILAAGNWHYEYDRSTKTWTQCAKERGVDWADWAWACLFWDYDNDTDKDLFVTNGYASNEDKKAPDW